MNKEKETVDEQSISYHTKYYYVHVANLILLYCRDII